MFAVPWTADGAMRSGTGGGGRGGMFDDFRLLEAGVVVGGGTEVGG